MKNIGYVAALALALYILTDMVDWSEPKFFDYFMIVTYSLCLILVIFNIVMYFKKRKD